MGIKLSAGILLYRIRSHAIQILLVHPGGPFWAKKDDGAWSIPKGEYDEGADALEAAKREFHEETGFEVHGETLPLIPVRQPSGKVISVWAVDGDIDAPSIRSTSSGWSGRRSRGSFKNFQRSIAPNGLISALRIEKSLRVSVRFWLNWSRWSKTSRLSEKEIVGNEVRCSLRVPWSTSSHISMLG